jgi:signal transduction histidine kinase/ActR/RegA family two-component response regulator
MNRGERIERLETERVRKDSQLINVSITISPIRDARGRITGAATVGRDITDRKRAEAERERLLAAERAARVEAEEARKLSSELLVREKASRVEAESANRAKDEFLALVSHELRTPLNAILGWVNILLRDGQHDAALRTRGLEVIKRNAALQVQIIEDILDVSRIIAGKLRLDIKETELPPVIQAAVAAIQPAAKEKGIRLRQHLDRGVPPVSGDPNRLQQIVWNLLSNAIKFTPAGGEVVITLEQSDSNASITVRDTGEGISPEFLPYVFDRFRQGDSSSTKRYSGLGLGLAIARELVELQGGKISAWSPGRSEGSVFTVTMPCAATRKPPLKERRLSLDPDSAADSPSLTKLRILLVDDDADSLDMLTTALRLQGAETRSARTVREALATLKTWTPDLLISDIGMPDEDGYVLIREVRAGAPPDQPQIPAIALTGYAAEHEVERVLASGYQVHLAKPVEPADLINIIAELKRQSEGTASRFAGGA